MHKSPADTLPVASEGDEIKAKRRKKGEAMSDEEVSSLVRDYLEGATNYRDETLTPEREKIQRYFEGDISLDGDLPASPRRAKFVSRDVRDVVYAVLPQLVDMLLGNDESIVEFKPVGAEDYQAARDATQYVQYLIRKHGGDELFIPVIMDAIKNHVGVVRYWWDERVSYREDWYRGLTEEERDALLARELDEEGNEFEEVESKPSENDPALIDSKIKTTVKGGNICFECVPPEERLIDENARSLTERKFTLWAHARSVPIGELVSMGYEEDELEDLEDGDTFLTNETAENRQNAGDRSEQEKENRDPSMRKVPYAECYVYGDLDGEGIPAIFNVCVGGAQAKVLHREKAEDGVQVAEFQTVPIEHVATGAPYAANVLDVQALRTNLWRNMLDSFAQSIFPQRGFRDGKVSVADLLNDGPGGLVRCDDMPGNVVTEFQHTFAGRDALAVLQYTEQTKEDRTGVSRNASGMDGDALQSVAKEAAGAFVGASDRQIKFIARMLANYGGLKSLFKGVLRLTVKHQKSPERVRLHNGQFATFDPTKWNPDMDCIVRTAIGNGTTGEKIGALDRIAAMQEKVAMAAPDMVGPQEIYNTASAYCELTPWRSADRFFKAPDPAKLNQPKPPPPPSPEELLAKAQMFDSETKRQSAIESNRNTRLKTLLDADIKRDQMEMDFLLGLAKLAIDAHQPIAIEQLRQQAAEVAQRDRSIDDYMTAIMADKSAGQEQQQQQQPAQGAPMQ